MRGGLGLGGYELGKWCSSSLADQRRSCADPRLSPEGVLWGEESLEVIMADQGLLSLIIAWFLYLENVGSGRLLPPCGSQSPCLWVAIGPGSADL